MGAVGRKRKIGEGSATDASGTVCGKRNRAPVDAVENSGGAAWQLGGTLSRGGDSLGLREARSHAREGRCRADNEVAKEHAQCRDADVKAR